MDKTEGSIEIFPRMFFVSPGRENSQGKALECLWFGYRTIVCLKGLCHDFSSNFFCLTVPKTLQVNPSVLCFGKFPLVNNFMDKKGGEYQEFPSKNFCLTVPKSFIGGTLL